MALNIIAVDDHTVALAGTAALLERFSNFALVGSFQSVDDACHFVTEDSAHTVDLVMLDLRLADGSDPYTNVKRFQELGIPALIFSSLESPYLTRRALNAGAAGILEKTATAEDIAEAIMTVCKGDTYATADWASIIDSDPFLGAVDLSPRQLEVLELYASGESAKQVASAIGLSTETVQDYLNRIRQKYAQAGRPANTKVDMYRRAQEDGYLPGPFGY